MVDVSVEREFRRRYAHAVPARHVWLTRLIKESIASLHGDGSSSSGYIACDKDSYCGRRRRGEDECNSEVILVDRCES